MSAEVAYNPGMDRFLIVWRDRVAAYDYDVIPGGGGMAMETAGDVRGTIYGVPQRKNPCLALKIYGEHSEEVEFLRYARDNILNRTSEGQELIRLYYQWGPVIAEAMEGDEEFGDDVKEFIDGILPLMR